MRKKFLLIFSIVAYSVSGNINYIKIDSIPESERNFDKYIFIKDNERLINHWTPDWTYTVKKETLIKELKDCFDAYSKCNRQNVEVDLLLGDISHYLYNLNETKYYEIAVNYYKKAIDLSPNDYRPLWFLANHFALSDVPEKAIDYFYKSQKLLPSNEPSDFWEEFCFASSTANMPSHCLYAMDKVRKLTGEPGNFELQLGQIMRNRIQPVKIDSTYTKKDIWSYFSDSLSTFICRPLGIKFSIAPDWNVGLYDYKNNRGFITIEPPGIKNKKGRTITYTIAIIIKVSQPNEKFEDFIDPLISKYPEKTVAKIATKYTGQLSFDFLDKEVYKEIGGAHMNLIGFERNEPEFAGLLFEQPLSTPQSKSGKIQYYRAANVMDRFKGKIYYAFMLDACEDIYDEAFKVFEDVFEKQIVIE